MIVACPECAAPFQIEEGAIAPLVQVACPHCSFRMILDFAAANDPGLVEHGMRMASGWRTVADYQRMIAAPAAEPTAVPREAETQPVRIVTPVAPKPIAPEPRPTEAPAAEPRPVAAPRRPAPEPRPVAEPKRPAPEPRPVAEPRLAGRAPPPEPRVAARPIAAEERQVRPPPESRPARSPTIIGTPAPRPVQTPVQTTAGRPSAFRAGSTPEPSPTAVEEMPEGRAAPRVGPQVVVEPESSVAPRHTEMRAPERPPPHTPPPAVATSAPPAEEPLPRMGPSPAEVSAEMAADDFDEDEDEFVRKTGAGAYLLVFLLLLTAGVLGASYVLHGTPDPRPLLEQLLRPYLQP